MKQWLLIEQNLAYIFKIGKWGIILIKIKVIHKFSSWVTVPTNKSYSKISELKYSWQIKKCKIFYITYLAIKSSFLLFPKTFEHSTTNCPWCTIISIQYFVNYVQFSSVQFVAQSCPTLCNPMDCSTPGFPVHHQLPEFAQTHVHRVGDAIQSTHLLSSSSPPALNLSQNQGLFKWVSCLHQKAEVLKLQLQHQSFQWIFRTDFL